MTKRSLRQLKKEKLSKQDIKKAAKEVGVDCDVDNLGDISGLENTIDQYKDKDEDELMSDLMTMVTQGRKDGTFSDDMLEQFIENVSPMMDGEQKKKLKNIANMLGQKK